MATQTNAAPAAPTASKPAPDYSKMVGKKFETKTETGLNSDSVFEVIEFYPKFNFGKAGKKPAFRLMRTPQPGIHVEACDAFLVNHDEVTEAAA